jgi:hypothetical protein
VTKAEPLHSIFDELREDDFPTAEYDVTPFVDDPISGIRGIRRSMPTVSNEVGPLPGEPEEDTLYRCFGCGARVLSAQVTLADAAEYHLDARQLTVLSLVDGETPICELIDHCDLPRHETLCALEELVILGVVA